MYFLLPGTRGAVISGFSPDFAIRSVISSISLSVLTDLLPGLGSCFEKKTLHVDIIIHTISNNYLVSLGDEPSSFSFSTIFFMIRHWLVILVNAEISIYLILWFFIRPTAEEIIKLSWVFFYFVYFTWNSLSSPSSLNPPYVVL